MKVAVLAEQLRRSVPGGIGTYIRGMVGALGGLGGLTGGPAVVDVSLWVTAVRGDDPLPGLAPVRAVHLPSKLATRAWDAGWLRSPPDADVVHAPSLLVPSPRPGVPVCVFVHDLAWRSVPEAYPVAGRRWHERSLGRARRRAARVLVPSVETADDLMAAGVDARRVHVVPEGCDHLPLYPRRAGGYLLSVSTLEPRKNLERLLAAYAIARPLLPEPWPLKVVGPAGWRTGEGASPLGPRIPEGVELQGMVDDDTLGRLFAGAEVLVYVPLAEGFGLPAVEAMRAGCPVVASPMPSTGGAARQVDPLDVDAMASAIVDTVRDAGAAADLTRAGLARASALTWRACAATHVEHWREMTA